MFLNINIDDNLEDVLKAIERNNEIAVEVRRNIQKLQPSSDCEFVALELDDEQIVRDTGSSFGSDIDDDYLEDIISVYYTLPADQKQIEEILPDPSDYRYNDIIIRLYAESLREIKEMIEISMEDDACDDMDVQAFIQTEYEKIDILQTLFAGEMEEFDDVEDHNKLLLIPNPNGKIRVLDDLNHIPNEHYDEINDLIMSIVNGTFKKVKKFNKSTNSAVGGVCEVKGNLARVFFKRLNHDTYAIITTFLKKTNNDRGYQEYIRCRIGEFKRHEDEYRRMLDDPEIMKLNDLYVEELFNRIGTPKDKVLKKVITDD